MSDRINVPILYFTVCLCMPLYGKYHVKNFKIFKVFVGFKCKYNNN